MPSRFLLKVRRAETPFYRRLKRLALAIRYLEVPVPRVVLPFCRLLYHAHWGVWGGFRQVISSFYVTPLFRGRCASSGHGLSLWLLPHVVGHAEIHVGDQVVAYGKFGVISGRIFDRPVLRIGSHVAIGHQVSFQVNREIIIEDHVFIADACVISDNDGHPLDPDLRAQHMPPSPEDIKPVRICTKAWLGRGVQVRKGVTIGEGAIIGVNSVVLTNVPANCIAIGNPARVVGFATGNSAAKEASVHS